MNGFELNKIAGAVLGTLMVVLGINILAGEIFHAPVPAEPGYLIAVAPEEPEAPDVPAVAEPDLGALLAAADPSAGQAAVRPCQACHTFEQGGGDRVGPNLYNIVGGPKAHVDGFNYSSAMQDRAAAGEVWGYEELDGFLADPRGYLPGTTMAFAGVRNPETRADMIMYLRELTEDPPPLPEPAAEEIDTAEAPPPDADDVPVEAEAVDDGLLARIAAADPAEGQTAARPCVACHTFEEGGADRVGPNLYNIVGGPKAHIEGFRYSSAMQEAGEAGEVWGYEELDGFLADPRGYMPGTTMAFAGVRDDDRRAALIAYMRELTVDPPPLPEQGGEETDAADAAPAEPEEDATAEAAPEAEAVDDGLLARIAAADPAEGQTAARPCVACHTFEEGGADRVGPNLYNIVGGPKAHIEGFRYSSAMQERAEAGEVWGYEELDGFLADPRGYMPGTTMAFAGVRDDDRRAALIAYMRELTVDPPPLNGE